MFDTKYCVCAAVFGLGAVLACLLMHLNTGPQVIKKAQDATVTFAVTTKKCKENSFNISGNCVKTEYTHCFVLRQPQSVYIQRETKSNNQIKHGVILTIKAVLFGIDLYLTN